MYTSADFVSGQPKAKSRKREANREQYFKLGYTASALNTQRLDNMKAGQDILFNRIMIENEKSKINEKAGELMAMTKALDAQFQQMQMDRMAEAIGRPQGQPPAMPPEVGYPGGVPMLPGQPQQTSMGMPQQEQIPISTAPPMVGY
jgi:hypothetical protein